MEKRLFGNIYKNTGYGIYGNLSNTYPLYINRYDTIPIALRNEIELGDAELISSVQNGETKRYKIKIEKIYLNNNIDNKSMIIKVVDDELIDKTAGIVQGMSGSPIIQNGKLIGALTHVMVNDTKLGYAVFAEIMAKNALE